jgi:4-hydroxy-tetrahydrodipicolinate reductase
VPIKVGIIGHTGKVGTALQAALKNDLQCSYVKGVDSKSSLEDYHALFDSSSVVIDFSLPSKLDWKLKVATDLQKPLVMGTTGFSENQKKLIVEASSKVPIFYSSNFSLGMFFFQKMLKTIEEVDWFDAIDLVEWHKAAKKDSPSGTALQILQEVNKYTNKKTHISSIRSGEVFCEHTLFFSSDKERVTLKHEAYDRAVYAKGAIAAAKFLIGKPEGMYSMEDLLTTQEKCTK